MWFCELSQTRSSNGFGANPISFAEIEAWARMTRSMPTPREVLLLRRLDAVALRFINAKNPQRMQVDVNDAGGLEQMFGTLSAHAKEAFDK
jgi:hypothetical protein